MHYRITITKLEDNPNYSEELKKYNEASRYQRDRMYGNDPMPAEPQRMFENNSLHTILNEEQFEAVRKGCLEKF